MTTEELIIAGIIGLGTGFASGLMGLGGGILLTPLLRLIIGIPQLIALATPLPVLIPTAVSGSVAYYKERKQDFKLAGYILITALPMTWVGAVLTKEVSGKFLMILTGVFILLVSITFLIRSMILKEQTNEAPPPISPLKALLLGAVGGLMSGLLAIGGGIIYIPAILRFFGRSMKVAQATSLIVVMTVAIPGSIKHHMLGNIDWVLALVLAITMAPGSYFGAKYALTLRNRTLERLFGIVTGIFGIYFLIFEIMK
jgi:uncharacterized membrane protein YfcA